MIEYAGRVSPQVRRPRGSFGPRRNARFLDTRAGLVAILFDAPGSPSRVMEDLEVSLLLAPAPEGGWTLWRKTSTEKAEALAGCEENSPPGSEWVERQLNTNTRKDRK